MLLAGVFLFKFHNITHCTHTPSHTHKPYTVTHTHTNRTPSHTHRHTHGYTHTEPNRIRKQMFINLSDRQQSHGRWRCCRGPAARDPRWSRDPRWCPTQSKPSPGNSSGHTHTHTDHQAVMWQQRDMEMHSWCDRHGDTHNEHQLGSETEPNDDKKRRKLQT